MSDVLIADIKVDQTAPVKRGGGDGARLGKLTGRKREWG
jgi:hypothetical protein